jgi:PTS system nitrogen regulatory IIA component
MIQIRDILTLERTLLGATAQSKKKALELISETIAAHQPNLNDHDIFDGLVARERLGSTSIGYGVAIPHTRLDAATEVVGCFILLKEGIDFDALDHNNIDMMFALVVPSEAHQAHLELLATLADLFRQEQLRIQLRQATSSAILYQRLISA